MLSYIYPILYGLSIIAVLINFKKIKQSKHLLFFLLFLFYTFLNESFAIYRTIVLKINSNILYLIWNSINFYFFTYFVFSGISTRFKKYLIYSLLLLFSVYTITNISNLSPKLNFSLVSNIVLAKICIVIVVIIYFSELLKSEAILNIKNSFNFWICLAMFLYNITFLPAFALIVYTSAQGIFRYITLGLNIVLHFCFIYGVFISEKKYNY